jgi:2-C-methyl-D-erythritol 4-phosphate cytidylyltransferase/2-C-methyl-D-erythritol 2,4-cyclodiphosphate synthase
MTRFRIGQGFDVHRYRQGRRLVLAGVEIPGETGLEGHSDADVVLHAVCDAVLGAIAAGDLGTHFPPSDERWRDSDSSGFLEHALALARERDLAPVNCDVTVIGERPKVSPHREAMRARLAELLGLPRADVSVKATTTEGLGFAGRREGLAAMAVVLMGSSDG